MQRHSNRGDWETSSPIKYLGVCGNAATSWSVSDTEKKVVSNQVENLQLFTFNAYETFYGCDFQCGVKCGC
jgi:hypothetical protein